MRNRDTYALRNRRLGYDVPVRLERAPALPEQVAEGSGYRGEAADSTGFMRYFDILRRWKWSFVLCALLGLAGALGICWIMTPVWQAQALIEVQNINEEFLNMKDVTPVHNAGYFDTLTDVETQLKALESDNLIRNSVRRLHADASDIESYPVPTPIWQPIINLFTDPPKKGDWANRSFESWKRMVKARVVPQTRDIEVSVKSTNKRLAVDYVNQICDEFVKENIQARESLGKQTAVWLDGLLKDMRAKLERSEAALQAYAESAGLLYTGASQDSRSDKRNMSEERLRETQDALSTARADRIQKQARYEQAQKSPNEDIPELADDQTLSDDRDKLADLRRQAADLSTTYTDGYGKLKRVEAEIASLEQSIAKERQSVVQKVTNDYLSAARRESLLEADYDAQSRVVSNEAEKTVQYNVLERQVDSDRAAYDAMLQRAQEVTLAAGIQTSNIRIVDRPSPPERPYMPKWLLFSVLGLFCGMVAGVGYVLLRESADSAIRQPGDGAQFLSLPELGVILHVDGKKAKIPGAGLLTGLSSDGDGNRADDGSSMAIAAWAPKSEMVADSFRGVRTSILFSVRGRDGARVFAMTSPGPGEGKTTAVANLGVALAEVSSRVLLIDGDLRRRRLSELFRVSNTRGLIELLQSPSDRSPSEFIQPTGVPGLSVVSGGSAMLPAAQLLHSRQLTKLLSRFRENFDVILIDTPPVLTAPDARILGRSADGVILLTRAGRTTRQAALAACERLANDGSVLLGTILNDWDPKTSFGSYHGYYGEYYVQQDEHPRGSRRSSEPRFSARS